MDSYTKVLIKHMATQTKTELTKKHIDVLEYAYDYYLKHKRGPLYESIHRQTQINQQELEKLFPQGLTSLYTWLSIPTHGATNLCKNMASIQIEDFKEIYLDHSATTFIRPEIAEALKNFYTNSTFQANPHSSHRPGKQAYEIVQEARIKIANTLQAHPNEIIFTSGGSESNNLAIKGMAFNQIKKMTNKKHIIANKAEHSSVLATLSFLESIGFKVSYLDVTKEGIIPPEKIKQQISEETFLVCAMAVNNEIGTINPLGEIGKICQEANIPFMVDGVQAFGKIKIVPQELGISLLSISGHKIYAPKGIGALYVKNNIPLTPLIHGGKQEQGLRAGTENVASIHSFGTAAAFAHKELDQEGARISKIRDYFINQLKKVERNFIINGSVELSVPHILNIGFTGIDSGSLLLSLNKIGIYVSAGSACTAGSEESSHVIAALGEKNKKYGSIRFSFGLETSINDIDYLIKYLPLILNQLRDSTR